MLVWTVPIALVASVAAGLESVRLGLRTPSLIDDWFAIGYSRPALHALVHGDYTSAHVDFSGRYRPAYTAVWSYAQWHLFGQPSVATAAMWGVLRAAAFLIAVWLLARLIAPRSMAWHPALWLAPIAVALTPGPAVDLVRHGSAEPIMVAGLVTGMTLVGVSVRGFLLDPETLRSKRAWLVMVSGYVLYLVGAYTKESSVCLLLFVPFLVMWLRPIWRKRLPESGRIWWLPAAVVVLLLAPLVHLAAHLAVAKHAGSDPYAGVHFSLARKVVAALVFPLIGAPGPLGTFLWLAVVPIAIAQAIRLVLRRHPDRWLVAGVLFTGFAMSAFSLARGDIPSRYYIPWLVAVAAVAVRSLPPAKPLLQLAVATLVIGLILPATRNEVQRWAQLEKSGSTAVEMATSVTSAGCPTYLANFDPERRVAIPRLLGFGNSVVHVPSCDRNSARAYVLSWLNAPLPHGFSQHCSSGWQEVAVRDRVSLYSCQNLPAQALPDQDAASGAFQVAVVRLHRPAGNPSPQTLFQSLPN